LQEPLPSGAPARTWLTSTDHKRIAILIMGTALVVFFMMGVPSMVMRYQLSMPDNAFLDNATYDEVFTIHGSGMIYLVMTPFGLGLGLYLIPLRIGAPNVAAPRATMAGYWFYVLGAFSMIVGFATTKGAASAAWMNYAPLSDSRYQPGVGQDLWLVGTGLSTAGMLVVAATVLWTVLTKRVRGMSMFRIPMFDWAIIVTNLLAVGAFGSLLAADSLVAVGRLAPAIFTSDVIDERLGYVDAQQVPVPGDEESAPAPQVAESAERPSVRRWVAVAKLGRGARRGAAEFRAGMAVQRG
jgi:cytochrome c oxidase subunit 1